MAYVFVRHRKYIDTCTNRVLLVTAGLFLMLCAFTHLYSLWSTDPSEVLLFLCALASFVSAMCFLYTFQNLDDYLSLRVATKDVMREDIVTNLTKGYDLKVVAEGNTIMSGVAGSSEVSEPIAVDGGLKVGGIIKVGESYFRVANIVESFVSVNGDSTEDHSAEHGQLSFSESTTTKRVYGHDASAEVRMRDESDRINRMKMDLCLLTAHHVKTPLSCLCVALNGLQQRLRSKECLQLLEEATVHCEIMNMVTTQFVDIATVGLDMTLRPCVDYVDIRSLSKRVQNVLYRIQMEEVRCKCTVGENVPRFVLTDGAWVMQIMMNLVANAARYTFQGSIAMKVNFESSQILSIVVRDTGVGVPDSVKRGVIEEDCLAESTSGHGSTGIGLHSVKMKVSALRGEYMVRNNSAGCGTVWSVRVPVRIDNRCFDRSSSEDLSVTRVRSILLVEDTPSVRKLMQRHMRDHDLTIAINGLDGLNRMKERKFDVVFLDMIMPVMDGAQCLQTFREWETYNRPVRDHQLVYCMSATSVDLGMGFDGSIPKPVDTNFLKHFLNNLP